MSIETKSRKIAPGYEPIAGYVLEEKLGQGGFGEVWRADAPGGLKKAVKFVFGATDENRGSRELKSLERIKGVHHPFLLTLERFGIVDDQLVIVTELADGSLEDVYDRHQKRGSCGIPRQALLKYLHDAADALDYLHSKFQLQHLDVKPGNLLLVGGHVKIADFGLLKDLREADCSVVGGLTPIYAPPEVFDGRPSLHSDQYSLAVMYQELLTGTRPFSGRTIAQLATQHVHSSPNLEALPPGDRPLLARALEKSPERRFASCTEFVDSLREVQSRGNRQQRSASTAENARTTTTGLGGIGSSSSDVEDLPQLEGDSTPILQNVTSHTLVVALGGAGAECLHELRSRVAKLHSVCPVDLHSILIDTDVETIHATDLAELSDRVPHCHTIFTPLKSPQDYRREHGERFKTISRRWIYNVPRTGKTEGVRPLGRLALVDHADQVSSTFAEAIDHLAAVAGDRVPKIYLVGSLAGGTASGMIWDVAHVLRNTLDSAGLEAANITPLLAAASLDVDSQNPMSQHSTRAALQEMRHFVQPGNSYPGDSGAGFLPLPAARTPLTEAYIVAAQTVRGQRVEPIETITDYLWADSTGAGDLLWSARQESGVEASASAKPAYLRSVGVVRLGCLRALEEKLLTPALIRHLMLRWLGRPAEAKQLAKPLCDRLIRRCEIAPETFIDAVEKSVGETDEDRRSTLVNHLRRLPVAAMQDRESVDHYVDGLLGEAVPQSTHSSVLAMINVTIKREITLRLHDRRLDLTSAIEAIHRLGGHVQQAIEKLHSDAPNLDWVQGDENRGDNDALFEWTLEYALRRLRAMATDLTIESLTSLQQSLLQLLQLVEGHAATLVRSIQATQKSARADENPWNEMPQEVRVRFESLLTRLHEEVAPEMLIEPIRRGKQIASVERMVARIALIALPIVEDAVDASHGIDSACDDTESTGESRTITLNHTMANGASVERSISQTAATATAEFSGVPTAGTKAVRWQENSDVKAALRGAVPSLLQCGGRQRLILLVGTESEREQLVPKLKEAHGGVVSVALIPGVTPMLIHEAQQIKLDEVIHRYSALVGPDRQLSQRLHTRADIDWGE